VRLSVAQVCWRFHDLAPDYVVPLVLDAAALVRHDVLVVVLTPSLLLRVVGVLAGAVVVPTPSRKGAAATAGEHGRPVDATAIALELTELLQFLRLHLVQETVELGDDANLKLGSWPVSRPVEDAQRCAHLHRVIGVLVIQHSVQFG
jgi:hypothetical protein